MYEIDNIKTQLENHGIVEFRNFLSCEQLLEYQLFFNVNGNDQWKRFSFPEMIDYEKVRSDLLKKLSCHPGILELFENVHGQLCKKISPDQTFFPNLRIFYGNVGEKEAFNFHFDAYALTILMPILIPDEENGKNGDLIIFRRRRKLHSNSILNLFQKLILQNTFVRYLFTKRIFQKLFKAKLVKLKPGNLYLFLGYQTIHGNLPCNRENIRATACYHYSLPIV
ncbi:hypothetical protein CL656_05010 [bacterium]|nr:hypothetical protein [bacterium]|tara:strand:+ start:1873 stop:2544 length:672 start_codon:yes stop_codon:yes gene_type:complete